MIIYRDAAMRYAQANPAFSGTVADASLVLPAWFNKPSNLNNYVDTGRAFAYTTAPSSALLNQLLTETKSSVLVGTKVSGFLVHPALGTTAVSLPSAIPEGAIVYASN